MTTLRAGLVGAGGICEFHVAALRALPDVELVGITDLDADKAARHADAWGTKAYASMDALIDAGANVIHVLTPPAVHGRIARAALERGCHVLVEKPVTEDAAEARELAALAAARGLTISVNHSLLYDPQVARALAQVEAGELGHVVSVDILRGSEYPPYEGGPLPPWYRQAGYAFRDLGVHCMYLLQAFLGPIRDVRTAWQSLGGDANLPYDEWRAQVVCERGMGQFQLSWNVRPMQSQIIIQGTRGVLRVDLFAMFQAKRSAMPLPKAAERLLNAMVDSAQPLVEVPMGVWKFARKEVQAYQGLRNLVADFYARLTQGMAPRVSVGDAAEVVEWIERSARAADAAYVAELAALPTAPTASVLVTGAAGSVGRALVRALVARGETVRVFVRRVPKRIEPGLQYAIGNLGDPDAVRRAVKGAQRVIHVGAAMKGGWPEHQCGTVVGTQNVIDACREFGVTQLVHISSMSVVDWAGSAEAGPVNEQAALEPQPEDRGAYTRAKLEAEQLVTAAATAGLPCVILRPGQIFGGGIPLINGAVARAAAGRWLVLGDGRLELPLVYLDDVVDAIIAAVDKNLVGGEVIQLIDRETLTQTEVLELAGGERSTISVPRAVVFALGKLSEWPLAALGKQSPISAYRLRSALARLHYESARAEDLLGWHPRVGVRAGIEKLRGG